jgi:Holliday junction DNA helicase RuvA
MIGKLTGNILIKNPPEILLEVGNIGYEILCPMSSFYKINDDKVSLYIHLHIKEDSHTMYGFISNDEKTLFRELIRVNGVGPKAALAILSNLDVNSLIKAVIEEEYTLLVKTPGIGKKTAQKLVVELKDRLEKLELTNINYQKNTTFNNQNLDRASAALQALGFKNKEADKMLSLIKDESLSTEELIRIALKNK